MPGSDGTNFYLQLGGRALTYLGTWNATTNDPALASGVGTKNNFYIVSVAGATDLDGITDWEIGDWAIFSGLVWQKLDQTLAPHAIGGASHTASTLAELNSKISDATLTQQNNISFVFAAGTSNYADTTNINYVVLGNVTFCGTTISGIPTSICVNSWLIGGTDYDIRIYDYTNNKIISEVIDQTNSIKAVVNTGTISNLPASSAIFEVQARCTGVAKRVAVAGGSINFN